jgi:glycine/D-amino acid oxidase-like deaminating enzyme
LQKAKEAGSGIKKQKVMDFLEKDGHVSVKTNAGIYQCKFLVIVSGCQDGLKNRILGPNRKESMGVCLVAEIEEDDRNIEERLAL